MDIVTECLVVMGDYYAGMWTYAPVRRMQRKFPGLKDAQDAVIECHLGLILQEQADVYGWSQEDVQNRGLVPEDTWTKVRLLEPDKVFLAIVLVAHALCEMSGRPRMFARIEALIDEALERK